MKRLTSLLIVLCFSFNALATTAGALKLERALDEHRYTMIVEWDQQDKDFARLESERFQRAITEIFQTESITAAEVEAVIGRKGIRKEALEKIRLELLFKGVTSAADLQNYLTSAEFDLYERGASWNGGVSSGVIWGGVGLLIVGAIVFLAWDQERCLEYKDEYYCRATESCSGTGDNETCRTTGSECGMFPRCQQYEDR